MCLVFCTFAVDMEVRINENDIIEAAKKGCEPFVDLISSRTLEAIGGELNADTMPQLTADQITLLAYQILKDEVLTGGFIQLIHNGYGPFIFHNPFAKAMRLWGNHELSRLLYTARALFDQHREALTAECTYDEFMALYEQYEAFDEVDDAFVEMEPEATEVVAHYIDEHISDFVTVLK